MVKQRTGQAESRAAAAAAAVCQESKHDVLSTLLIIEQIATIFYYQGLTAAAVVGHPYLAGTSADPNHVSSNGSAVNVACPQAALDQERQHAGMLAQHGASSPYTHAYFPGTTFAGLGYTSEMGTFLWVLDHLETVMVGAYLAAISRFAALGDAEMALLLSRMLGPECQHRAIGRVIAGGTPANNMALQVSSFTCVTDAKAALHPYLTGKGFSVAPTAALALPKGAAIAAVVGKNGSN